AGHEADLVPLSAHTITRTQVYEIETLPPEQTRPANRVAPVRVAAVHDDVARFKRTDEDIKPLVNRRPGGNIQEDNARLAKLPHEARCVADLDKAGVALHC